MTIERRYSMKDIQEVAGGVSHAYIYKQINLGKLAKPEKWGRISRWKESDVLAWLDTVNRGLNDTSHLIKARAENQ